MTVSRLIRTVLRRELVGTCVLLCQLARSSMATATTAAPAQPICPSATPERLWVDPVTSPTNQFSQAVTVYIGNADRIEVITESGHYSGDLSTSNPAQVTVRLLPFATNHLEVVAHVKLTTAPG